MRVIKEAADSSGFTVDDISDGILNDFGFKGSILAGETFDVNITNDSEVKFKFDVDELGIIKDIKSAEFVLPKDMNTIDLVRDESKVEELSAMLISASEVLNYVKEKLI